ncbi:MAG: flagellar protein [Cellulosilyticum sp.]|nr:flagellar protein [Cellulosilyticum sp.]
MEVKVCKSCKRMFQHIAGPIMCPKCKAIEEDRFQIVKEYLRENPGASLADVSAETGIESKIILRFLREGRLEVSEDSPISLVCEQCGKKIFTGIRCSACEAQILKSLNELKGHFVQKDTEDTSARMRFLDAKKFKR